MEGNFPELSLLSAAITASGSLSDSKESHSAPGYASAVHAKFFALACQLLPAWSDCLH